MLYDFGTAEQFERKLIEHHQQKRFARFFPQDKQAHRIAQYIHGEMTPEQFFEGWDRACDQRQDDEFPVAPQWVKHLTSPAFYREFRTLWYRRHAEHRDKYGRITWDIGLILSISGPMITFLSLGISCTILAGYIEDTQARNLFLSLAGVILGIYLVIAMFTQLTFAFLLPSRKTLITRINARRAQKREHRAA